MLYKYLAEEKYARALIDKGQVFAQPLSYFRAFEVELMRGEPDDGKLNQGKWRSGRTPRP